MRAYYVLVLVVGAITAIRCAISRPSREIALLLVVLVGSFIPLVLVFVSHDGRFRIGFDLLLACFAGYGWARLTQQRQRTASASGPQQPAARAGVIIDDVR